MVQLMKVMLCQQLPLQPSLFQLLLLLLLEFHMAFINAGKGAELTTTTTTVQYSSIEYVEANGREG
eukprot:m.270252 g.270252  ORF g.270252 m.270252 type:complete len:66 (+) comp40543_c0_seq52:3833-4030(+)